MIKTLRINLTDHAGRKRELPAVQQLYESKLANLGEPRREVEHYGGIVHHIAEWVGNSHGGLGRTARRRARQERRRSALCPAGRREQGSPPHVVRVSNCSPRNHISPLECLCLLSPSESEGWGTSRNGPAARAPQAAGSGPGARTLDGRFEPKGVSPSVDNNLSLLDRPPAGAVGGSGDAEQQRSPDRRHAGVKKHGRPRFFKRCVYQR